MVKVANRRLKRVEDTPIFIRFATGSETWIGNVGRWWRKGSEARRVSGTE